MTDWRPQLRSTARPTSRWPLATWCHIAVALVAIITPWVTQAAQSQLERSFGYVIGDTVTVISRFDIPADANLDDRSLPRPGRISAWLALQSVTANRNRDQLVLERRFQFTASSEQVRLLFLPSVTLRFTQADQDRSERADAVPVSVSPLVGAKPFSRAGLGIVRPDQPAPMPDIARIESWLRLALLALALAVAAAAGLALHARRLIGFAPFRSAARDLGRLARRHTVGADEVSAGYRRLHRAFDAAAGQTVFGGNLEALWRVLPQLAPQQEAIADFYAGSEARFFGDVDQAAPARFAQTAPSDVPQTSHGGSTETSHGGSTETSRSGRNELRRLRDFARTLAATMR